MEQVYAIFDNNDAVEEDYEIQKEAEEPITTFAANRSDPDTLYHNQATQAEDSAELREVMIKEANDHTERVHWEVFWESNDVPEEQDICPAIWAFKQKHQIDTRAVYTYKYNVTDVPTS
jgi:hypothetical protein